MGFQRKRNPAKDFSYLHEISIRNSQDKNMKRWAGVTQSGLEASDITMSEAVDRKSGWPSKESNQKENSNA